MKHTNGYTLLLAGALAMVAGAGMTGCRGERSDAPPRQFLPDMDDTKGWTPQDQSAFFTDNRTMRPRVQNTVAYGESNTVGAVPTDAAGNPDWDAIMGMPEWDRRAVLDRLDALADNDAYYRGVSGYDDGEPVYAGFMPVDDVLSYRIARSPDSAPLDRDAALSELITRGQERFNIYCMVCHGHMGQGSDPTAQTGGTVGRRWTTPVPSFHDRKYTDRSTYQGTDGWIFHTALNGVVNPAGGAPRMPAYKDKLSVEDAWAIVAYIRVLQASWQEDTRGVPPEILDRLEQTKPDIPPPPGSAEGTEMSSAGSARRTEDGS